MEEDVTKIYEEYSEELLFCKYYIAEKLKHHAEMGRCGENILKKMSPGTVSNARICYRLYCLGQSSKPTM